jgi:hypothetical protein
MTTNFDKELLKQIEHPAINLDKEIIFNVPLVVNKLRKKHKIIFKRLRNRKIIVVGRYDVSNPIEFCYYSKLPVNENLVKIFKLFREFENEMILRLVDLSRSEPIYSNSHILFEISEIIGFINRLGKEFEYLLNQLKMVVTKNDA